VRDGSNRQPDLRPAAADSETGRGLHIVERLSAAWGWTPLSGAGKTVWFELDASRPAGQPPAAG
jgi:hypothetical protein